MQGVEPLFPQAAVTAQPFVDLGQGRGLQGVDASLRVLAELDDPGFAKDT